MYQKGSDLKDAFKNIGPANTPVQNSGASSSFAGLAQSNSEAIVGPAELKAYGGQIDQLNVLDSDDSDLIAIFNLLRTLKNQ